MFPSLSRRAFAGLLLAAAAVVPARADDGVALLRQWLQTTHAARADFTQTVVDDKGRATPPASGSFTFERPGRFRWVYTKPYRQDIVSDGRTIWTYDHDLDQVTQGEASAAVNGTPAALLAGTAVDKLFTLSALPPADGLQWVQATPRTRDGSFDWVRIGLKPGAQGPELAEMQLRDAFRRTSRIVFGNVERNPRLGADTFRFTAPPGAAVVRRP